MFISFEQFFHQFLDPVGLYLIGHFPMISNFNIISSSKGTKDKEKKR
ncbi:MAG: hypothetical protein ACTSXU_02855 [Promethearchaeota archaeon]